MPGTRSPQMRRCGAAGGRDGLGSESEAEKTPDGGSRELFMEKRTGREKVLTLGVVSFVLCVLVSVLFASNPQHGDWDGWKWCKEAVEGFRKLPPLPLELRWGGPIRGVEFRPEFGPPLPSLRVPPLSDLSDGAQRLTNAELRFVHQLHGPESLAWDSRGRLYASVSDGRVVRWGGHDLGWKTFATSTERLEKCEPSQEGRRPNLKWEAECGRPLGLYFSQKRGGLYFCDSYFGVMFVDSDGGKASVVVDHLDGTPFKFANDLVVDEENDVIYFTDSSTKYHRREFLLESMEGGATGRLLKHDLRANHTSVVLDQLRFPNGVSLSANKSFLLIAENTQCRILRYWLEGVRAGSLETLLDLPGFPDNIRITERGTFWVAVNARRNAFLDWLRGHPQIRKQILSVPLPLPIIYGFIIGFPHGLAIEFNEEGVVLTVLEDRWGQKVKSISEVHEHDGELFLGSILAPHIAVMNMKSIK